MSVALSRLQYVNGENVVDKTAKQIYISIIF